MKVAEKTPTEKLLEFNQDAYNKEYKRTHYYRPTVLLPKEVEPLLKMAAEAAGESVSEYIENAIMQRLEEE